MVPERPLFPFNARLGSSSNTRGRFKTVRLTSSLRSHLESEVFHKSSVGIKGAEGITQCSKAPQSTVYLNKEHFVSWGVFRTRRDLRSFSLHRSQGQPGQRCLLFLFHFFPFLFYSYMVNPTHPLPGIYIRRQLT